MKKLFLALALTSLSSCAALPLLVGAPSAPVAVANTTILDEQVALGVELAYKAARLAVETGVEAGYIKGSRAAAVAKLDNQAFSAVLAVRQAYRLGNSSNYAVAAADATRIIGDLLAATRRSN